MVSEAHKLTYEDYLRMPDNGHRYEIIEGELFVSPPPAIRHQVISGNLLFLLRQHVAGQQLGTVICAPCAVRITPNEPVEPDLIFIAREHANIIGEVSIDGPPDLVVEIVSPFGQQRDRVTKFNRYAQVGVRGYWIVDPVEETVDQYVLQDGQYEPIPRLADGAYGSTVMSDLRLTDDDIFAC